MKKFYNLGARLDCINFTTEKIWKDLFSEGRQNNLDIQSTLIISKSKGLSEIHRDIRTSTYQVCRT